MNYEKALYIDSVNLKYELNDFNLIHIENLLYNQAWAYYEIDREQNNQKSRESFGLRSVLQNLIERRANKFTENARK